MNMDNGQNFKRKRKALCDKLYNDDAYIKVVKKKDNKRCKPYKKEKNLNNKIYKEEIDNV